MDKLKSQEKARIIMVNSEGHRFAAWGLRLDDLNWEKRQLFRSKKLWFCQNCPAFINDRF